MTKRRTNPKRSNKSSTSSIAKSDLERRILARIEGRLPELMEQTLPAIVEQTIVQEQYYSGPLPPAEESRKYEDIHPGFMDRWISMAEREQTERFVVVKRRDGAEMLYRLASLAAGSVLAFLMIGGGIWLVHHDKNLEGFTALGIGVASVLGAIVYSGRKARAAKK